MLKISLNRLRWSFDLFSVDPPKGGSTLQLGLSVCVSVCVCVCVRSNVWNKLSWWNYFINSYWDYSNSTSFLLFDSNLPFSTQLDYSLLNSTILYSTLFYFTLLHSTNANFWTTGWNFKLKKCKLLKIL